MEVSGKTRDPPKSHRKPGCQNDVQLCCQPCQKDGLNVPVHGYCQDCTEHLCDSCYKTHRKPAPCRNHVLLDKNQMPKTQGPGQLPVPNDLTEQCQQHRGKLIEYFCQDHNVLGCSPCVTINHRSCKVDYIPDVSENYITGYGYKLLVYSLKTLQQNFKKIVEGVKSGKKKILENKATVKNEISKFRQEVISMFDDLEANLQQEADDLFAEESTKIDAISTRSSKLLEEIENLQDDLKKLEKANKSNALYMKSKAYEALVQEYTSTSVQTQNKTYVNTFSFKPNIALKAIMLGSETNIGELHQSGTETLLESGTRKNLYKTLKAKPLDEINIKIPSDKKDCSISGVVVIGQDTVAVTDSVNKSVKIVDTEMKKVVSNKKLSSRPEGVEILPKNLLAVALSERKILFLSIPAGLSEVRSLKLDGKCKDLVDHDGKLIVTFELPGKIQIMSMEGHIFKTIEQDSLGNSFECPMVTVSGNKNIYISDWDFSAITCMNFDGKETNMYKSKYLVRPRDMVVLEDGSILVCSSGNNTIQIISGNLETGRIILEGKDGLICPWGLALDREQNKLYVSSGRTCNSLKVFDCI